MRDPTNPRHWSSRSVARGHLSLNIPPHHGPAPPMAYLKFTHTDRADEDVYMCYTHFQTATSLVTYIKLTVLGEAVLLFLQRLSNNISASLPIGQIVFYISTYGSIYLFLPSSSQFSDRRGVGWESLAVVHQGDSHSVHTGGGPT